MNLTFGCSIERDWKRMRDADFVAQYRDRVGAGIMAAALDMRAIDGLREVASSKGI